MNRDSASDRLPPTLAREMHKDRLQAHGDLFLDTEAVLSQDFVHVWDGGVASFSGNMTVPFTVSATAHPPQVPAVSRSVPIRLVAVEDKLTRRVLTDLGERLETLMDRESMLAGVRFDMNITPFESLDERDLRLWRVELGIPGIPSRELSDVWERMSGAVRAELGVLATAYGRTTPLGREARRILNTLSVGVVPW